MFSKMRVKLTQPGWVILIAILVLLAVGVASIYVTNTHYSRTHDGPRNAMKQIIFACAAVLVALAVLRIGYIRISEHAYLIFFVALIGLLPLLAARILGTDFGGLIPRRNGAYRWIQLPAFQLQPSEFMKVAYILALSAYLHHRKSYRTFTGLMVPFAMTCVPLGLILVQPDLGTALLLIPVLFVMVFMAGARIKHLAIIMLVGVLAVPLVWAKIQPYQRLRVAAVLLQSDDLRKAVIEDPDSYEFLATKRQAIEWSVSSGYQLVHSKNAIGSGGVLGEGWGEGIYVQYGRLPDRHNDFIFAIIGHQWGLLGCLLVLGCYGVIVVTGVAIASATTDPFGRLLAVGVVSLLSTQVMINIAMTLGMMPITGMSLPFVSYGGSNLLTNFLSIGLLVSVARRRPFTLSMKPFEFGERQEPRRHPVEFAREASGRSEE